MEIVQVISAFEKSVDEFSFAVDSTQGRDKHRMGGSSTKHWIPPQAGWIKVNVDAATKTGKMLSHL